MDVGAPSMESLGIRRLRRIKTLAVVVSALAISACASKVLKYKDPEKLKVNQEFEESVHIVIPEETKSSTQAPPSLRSEDVLLPEATTTTTLPVKVKKTVKKEVKKEKVPETPPPTSNRRQPDIESDIGFDGRRPLKDPFRVGERVVHALKYFNVTAGEMALEVRNFAQVNSRKSYNFATVIKSSSLFSSFYSVDDVATTLVDYDTLVPSVFTLAVKESAQLREARAIFDSDGNKAKFWEKKVTSKDGEEEKKIEWEILPYSQNVYSVAFYMRIFKWDVGTENAFRVAQDGENLVFKGKCIRREKIKTEAGEFTALVIKPEVTLKGTFRPTGDVYFWLSDDDRKFILKIEAKIKIGTIVSEATEIHPGNL